MILGSESNPNLYCKLDIDVYPIVRTANKDPSRGSAIGTMFAKECILTRNIRTGRTSQRVELQDRSRKLAQWLGRGSEYRKSVLLRIRKRRYVCTKHQLSNNKAATGNTNSAVAQSLPSEMPGTQNTSLYPTRDTKPQEHSQQGGQISVGHSALRCLRRSPMQGEQL